ncbi:hypothetical protein Q5P01_016093 [Channa striata]|uniref:Uncharacterized protein n=1 Tax=Channa striata TaxID=64152 RepID=A0AA88MEJ3_CHASR|nr:hypothetical protein Q5P01_016093 [Channa striata]
MKWTLLLILESLLADSALGWTYHYSNNTMNWTMARRFCQSHYTDLVVIQNQKENDYLVSKLPNKEKSPYYWIGIYKTHWSKNWTWVGNNSTWIGNQSWAKNEPNNNHSTEFCVEIYLNSGINRGKWNDEKCSFSKHPVCFQAQCNATSCVRGQCQETIENTTCLCEPGFMGERCQTAVECSPLSHPENGYLVCSGGNQTFNSTCHFKCQIGFLLIGSSALTCEVEGFGAAQGLRYKQALIAVAGCGAFSAFCCVCFCWAKHKRKKLAQVRQTEEAITPPNEVQG